MLGHWTVGYWTDWPGEWRSPVILKLTIVGVRHCLLSAGSWSQHLQPHRGGSSEHCRWWFTQISDSVSLYLRTCFAVGEPASSNVSSHLLNHLSSWVLAARSKPFINSSLNGPNLWHWFLAYFHEFYNGDFFRLTCPKAFHIGGSPRKTLTITYWVRFMRIRHFFVWEIWG